MDDIIRDGMRWWIYVGSSYRGVGVLGSGQLVRLLSDVCSERISRRRQFPFCLTIFWWMYDLFRIRHDMYVYHFEFVFALGYSSSPE